MGVEVLDQSLETNGVIVDEAFEEFVTKKGDTDIDARRRLEDKLEEVRLRREMREYDFDI